MKSSEFRRWLTKQGATFGTQQGSHIKIYLNGKQSCMPVHGKDLGTGLVAALSAKKNLRVLRLRPAEPKLALKQISGGFLLQDEDRASATVADLTCPTQRKPTAAETTALLFAWKVCKHVKSNAIVYARLQEGFGQTVGVGAGQMSRVDAARFGAMKATLPLEGTVAASDAFFPFADGLEVVANAGATAIIQPGGSVRDAEVIAAADRLGIAMVFTGVRHFRHG